jgi:hypothetical protein
MSTTASSRSERSEPGAEDPLAKQVAEVLRLIQDRSPVLAGALSALGLGAYLMLDDAKDFGRLDRLHHWQYGAALLLGGVAGVGFGVLDMLSKNPPRRPRMPKGLLEQGAPLYEVLKMK